MGLGDEAVHLRGGARPLDAGAGHQHRALGGLQQLDGPAHLVAIRREPRRLGADWGNRRQRLLDLGHEDVHRNLEVGGPRDAGDRVADRELDVLGDAVGLVDGVGVLGDGPHHADVVHLLERAAAQVREGPLSAEHEDRRVRAPGVGDAGDPVGDAGPRRDGGDADAARVAARPGVGRVDGRLLVAHVDDLDALVDAAVVEGHDVAAAEREDTLDAGLLERLGRELPAVDGHWGAPRIARSAQRAERERSPTDST